MPKFNEIAHKGTCDVCGKQADDAVCASSCGPISLAYCRSCLEAGLEPYGIMFAYISGAGHWPDDINPAYQELVRKNLAFHGKTEEEFAAGVERAIKAEQELFG